MQQRYRWAVGAVAAAAVTIATGIPPASAATTPLAIKSTFNASNEGWRVIGDTTAEAATFRSTGGNPGGYAEAADAATGGVMYWLAPAKFLGDRSGFYEGKLLFDLRQSATDTQFDDNDVELEGGGLTLTFNHSPNPGTNWTHYAISLRETAGWRNGSVAATEADMRNALKNLTALRIRAEFRTGADTDGLDNVTLASGPQFTVNNVSVAEGNSGTKPLTFVVKLTSPSAKPQTVNFATANGTALAGQDYQAKTGTLSFPAGTTSKTVMINVVGDTVTENPETFKLQLSGGSVPINKPTGVGTITNDD